MLMEKLGNWATPELNKTELEVRNNLSLLEDFKPSLNGLVGRVYEIVQKVPARKSLVGPLTETKGILSGNTTKGGAIQYDFLHNFDKAEKPEILKFFEPIEEIIIK
jgi:hypothetical protein